MTDKPSRRLIAEQAEKLLGRSRMAEGLQVSEDEIQSWCEGRSALSDSQLLRLSDLLAKYAASKRPS
jgi:plasmid maintenance system antidote protein VapI